jgi:hypothetical protein
MLPGVVKKVIHPAADNMGWVKSRGEIEDDIVAEFYPILARFSRQFLFSSFIKLTVFYAVSFTILKALVFQATMHLSAFAVLLYPFTVALPTLFGVL